MSEAAGISRIVLPVGVSYATTHSGPGLGVDVLIGLALLWLWDVLVRDAVVDLVPALRRRAPARVRLSARGWLLAPLAVAVGAGTHVLWDSVTHDWGFVVREVAFLREELGPLPVYRWLQHVSTVVGSAVVGAYCLVRLRRQPVLERPASVRRPGLWIAPVALAGVAVGGVLRDWEAGVGAALAGSLVVAAVWRLVQ